MMRVVILDVNTFEQLANVSIGSIRKFEELLHSFEDSRIHHCSIGGGKLYIYIIRRK